MSLFSDVKTGGVENTVEEDSTGPVYTVDSGLYDAVIDMAYIQHSKSSNAKGVLLKVKLSTGTTINETVWFTNRDGNIYYQRDGQNMPLPGYSQINGLAGLLTGKGFLELEDEIVKKQVMIYSYDDKKEVPTEVDVVMPFVGKRVKAAVLRTYQDVGDRDNNWAPSGYSRETNVVDKFADIDTLQTHGEKAKGADGNWIKQWEARNTGLIRDQTANKIGLNPKPKGGNTQSNVRSASAAATPAKPKESLFDEDIPL